MSHSLKKNKIKSSFRSKKACRKKRERRTKSVVSPRPPLHASHRPPTPHHHLTPPFPSVGFPAQPCTAPSNVSRGRTEPFQENPGSRTRGKHPTTKTRKQDTQCQQSAVPVPSVQRSPPAPGRCQIDRVPKGDAAVIAEPGSRLR